MINNYYPFLDKESIQILDSLMEVAPNYIAFVDNLVNIICTDDPSSELRYLGLIHAATIANKDSMIRIRNSFDDDIIVNALTFWATKSSMTKEAASDFFRITEDALSTKPEQWIAISLLVDASSLISDFPEANKYLDKAKTMIENNEKLQFCKGYLHLLQGMILRREGSIDDAEEEFERGIENSKEFDNSYLEVHLLESLASTLKEKNTHVALEKLEKAYGLSKQLGDTEEVRSILNSMGLVYTVLGEYDLALQAHLESLERQKSETGVSMSVVLARLYCDLGRGKEALEWIQWGESAKGEGWISIMWHLAKALSLIRLEKVDDAASILDTAREMAFKSGSDWTMADYYYVQGNFYLAINDTDSALEYLERSIGISEPMMLQLFINRSLIALTKTEIAQVSKTKVGADPESSGRWMSKLATHAKKMNYPGIRMQHAILKAEYQSIRNDYESARETLEVALEIYDSPSVKSLKKTIREKITELDKVTSTC
jgi:tetratricopeptide (TPR) repeat protein